MSREKARIHADRVRHNDLDYIKRVRRESYEAGYNRAMIERADEFNAPDNMGGVLAKAIAMVKASPEEFNELDYVNSTAGTVRKAHNKAVKRRERLEREL